MNALIYAAAILFYILFLYALGCFVWKAGHAKGKQDGLKEQELTAKERLRLKQEGYCHGRDDTLEKLRKAAAKSLSEAWEIQDEPEQPTEHDTACALLVAKGEAAKVQLAQFQEGLKP